MAQTPPEPGHDRDRLAFQTFRIRRSWGTIPDARIPIMDRTAIAAIIIGLGGTVAAMVYPVKYPEAPKWAVNLNWWGGLFLVFAGVIYLMTEHVGSAIIATLGWFWGYIIALLHMTAFWLVMVFAAGMAAHRWSIPLILTWWTQAQVDRSPIVTTWQTPLQVAERFVDPDVFSKYRTAQENAKSPAAKVKLLEAELSGTVESEIISELKEQLTGAARARDDADYVARRRHADVVEYLRGALKSQILVAKGCKVVRRKTGEIIKEKEQYLPNDWGITIAGVDVIDLNTAIVQNGFPQNVHRDVLIGRDEKRLLAAKKST